MRLNIYHSTVCKIQWNFHKCGVTAPFLKDWPSTNYRGSFIFSIIISFNFKNLKNWSRICPIPLLPCKTGPYGFFDMNSPVCLHKRWFHVSYQRAGAARWKSALKIKARIGGTKKKRKNLPNFLKDAGFLLPRWLWFWVMTCSSKRYCKDVCSSEKNG